MLAHQTREELLILAKTYPLPSAKYRETVCVAAINRAGELRRLYPIPFRFLDGESKFRKWEWIRAVVGTTPKDKRPESRRLDVDMVEKLGEPIPTTHRWQERRDWIEPRLVASFEELESRRQRSGETLGFVRPTQLLGLDITPHKSPDWTEEERFKLSQEGLFDTDAMRARPPLRKVPFRFHYRYLCGESEHRHLITDWEAGALYWNCVKSHGDRWEAPFRARLETEFARKDLTFMMGTVHRFPQQWLIISFIYPPKTAQTAMNFD